MLLSAEKITKNYGDKDLLKDISLYVDDGDKIGIIGINGTGKSTLLKIMAQIEDPDSGTISKNQRVRVQYLHQNPVLDERLSILEQVFAGIPELRESKEFEAKKILTQLGITDFDQPIRYMSGGQRRRVAITGVLIRPCDVLILDEPTNHLDNAMIVWLENYLIKFKGAILMVTHDRYFLERIVNKIVEIDRGSVFTYEANYSKYLELKAEREEMEQASERKRQSLLRTELAWMRQGPKARGTKSKERIARFYELSEKSGPADEEKLEMSSMSSRLGKKTVELSSVSKVYDGRTVIRDLDHIVLRDDRIGIVGPNGCGKSTLLKIIAGRLKPDSGSVVIGETVKIGYLSQDSEELDLSQRVIDFIKSVAAEVETAEGTVSASQMLERFLFPPELQWNTIGRLSGGERRRLYLLSILMQAPNVLLLDEPANDLDVQTLTILEEYLQQFNGAVITVSHDRYFLDKVVDTIFEFRGDGEIRKYLGSFSDYMDENTAETDGKKAPAPKAVSGTKYNSTKKLKFSFNEQREYDTIDADIAALEVELQELEDLMQREASDYVRLQEIMEQKEATEKALDDKMERWMYLNELAEKIAQEKISAEIWK